MSMVYVGYLGILLMLSLSVLGMPMAYAMCVVASMGLSLTLGPVNATTQSIFVMWEQASNFSLMSIPLFIFMGTIAFHSGIVGNLFIAFRRWIGFLPGGLAAAGVMAAGAFGAVTGSTAAASATMASTVIPELEKAGYDRGLSAGAIAASGGLAAIIPPSVFVIIYAVLTDQSAGQMFVAILGPGLLTTGLFAGYCVLRCMITPSMGPRQPTATWKERIACLPAAIPGHHHFRHRHRRHLRRSGHADGSGRSGLCRRHHYRRLYAQADANDHFAGFQGWRENECIHLLSVYRWMAHVAFSGHHGHHAAHGGFVRRLPDEPRDPAVHDVLPFPGSGLHSRIHVHSGSDHAFYVSHYPVVRR